MHNEGEQEVLKLHLNSRQDELICENDKMVIPLSAVNQCLF